MISLIWDAIAVYREFLYIFDPKVDNTQISEDLNIEVSDAEKVGESEGGWCKTKNIYKSAEGADAIVILTEWDEFKEYDWKEIYANMSKPAYVYDGRNILDKDKLESIGFNYIGLGR